MTVDLQQARAKAVTRLLAIAEALKAEAGVTSHHVRKGLSGRAWPSFGLIQAPEGKTRKQLYILAHECAHVVLHKNPGRKPSYVREHEAEMWAHAALRRHGVAVPKEMTKRAKRYVAQKLRAARKQGLKQVDAAALRFCSED